MQLTVYWSNLFISICVFGISWIATSTSMLESFGIALIAFISANILENTRRLLGVAPKARSLSLVKPDRQNPRKTKKTRKSEPKNEENKKED